MTAEPLVGTSVRRKADFPLLTGEALFVGDVERPGQLWARVVRSTVAHGRIRDLEIGAARASAGVVTVLTADDFPDVRIPIRLPLAETPQTPELLQGPLARERIRYVGEPVAVVVADDPYRAEDAAEQVVVDVEELDPLVDHRRPSCDREPAIHPSVPGNVLEPSLMGFGDVGAAFEAADVVVREKLYVHRHAAVPLETRGLVAEVDPDSGRLTVWGATKVKHFNRQALSQMLGRAPEDIRLLEVNVGGGFGARGEFHPEDYLIPLLAERLGRPVKWVEDRSEHFVATNHAREQRHEFEVAATADGRLLAFRDRALVDQGAYVRTQGIAPQILTANHMPGPYAWEAFSIEAAGALSTRTPIGTHRGPGMTEATFVRERTLDVLAATLRIDPAELRLKNLIPAESMPFAFDLGADSLPLVYESGDYPAAFERLLAETDYEARRAAQRRGQDAGERLGLGVAAYVEVSAIGPYEEVRINPTADGHFVVRTGVASLGQGVETALAQIAADELRVPIERVTIEHRDTDKVPSGFGSFGSRSTVLAGNAIALAAGDLRTRAATELETDAETVVFGEGVAFAAGQRERSLELAELGEGFGKYEQEHPSYSFGAALSQVTLEEGTGRVEVQKHVVAHDVGRAVNPLLLDGQLVGAAAQGIAGALLEEFVYDEYGQPLATSFVDYLLPTAADLPPIETVVIEHRNTTNPLGINGAGESGIVGTPAAIAAATADALGAAGSKIRSLPLTPERIARHLG